MPLVALSADEQKLATEAGKDTFRRRRQQQSKHRWNRGNDHSEAAEIESYGAEIAAGNVIGVKWVYDQSPNHDGDLGPGKQVRHTQYPYGRLLLHPEDEDSHRFILVTGKFPRYHVVGWLRGVDGKRKEHWGELTKGRPCFSIRQSQLKLMSEWEAD